MKKILIKILKKENNLKGEKIIMNTNDLTCNLVSLGKTGVGKSTLLNYLFNLNYKTGVGKPVTEPGLHPEDTEVKGRKVRVFDSWGIEVDKVNKWKEEIDKELREHGSDKAPEEWFHAVLYCIQAGGAKIEDIDTQIISRFINESYHVIIILTKADQLSEEDEEEFKQIIEKEIRNCIDKDKVDINDLKLEIVSVCSIEKELRAGITKQFGRDELIKRIFDCFSQTMATRLAPAIIYRLKKSVRDFFEEKAQELKNTKVSSIATKNDKLLDDLKSEIESFCKKLIQQTIPEEIKKLLNSYNEVGIALSNIFDATSYFDSLSHLFDSFYTQICSKDAENRLFNFLTLGLGFLKQKKEIKMGIQDLYKDCRNSLNTEINNKILPYLREQLKEALRNG